MEWLTLINIRRSEHYIIISLVSSTPEHRFWVSSMIGRVPRLSMSLWTFRLDVRKMRYMIDIDQHLMMVTFVGNFDSLFHLKRRIWASSVVKLFLWVFKLILMVESENFLNFFLSWCSKILCRAKPIFVFVTPRSHSRRASLALHRVHDALTWSGLEIFHRDQDDFFTFTMVPGLG